jgi:hypothetical protein
MTTESVADTTTTPALAEGDAGFVVEGTVDTNTPAEGEQQSAAGEGEAAKEEGKAPEGAPESYADFVLPEGVTLDSELLAEFTPVLKELNLSQAQAQKVIDFAPKLISQAVEGLKAQMIEEARSWHDASRADKEIGGAKMAENLAIANKAFVKFGTPELKTFLASRGLNAHPELIRAFVRAGKAISEDTHVAGGSPAARAKPFYDNSRMN